MRASRPRSAFFVYTSLMKIFLCVFLLTLSLSAEILTGTISHVGDADGFRLLVGKKSVTVRLLGIDAPEMAQKYGQTSAKYFYGMI